MVEALVGQCMRKLRQYSRPGRFHHPNHGDRALALERCMARALANGDPALCTMMLATQLHLMAPGYDTGLKEMKGEFDGYPEMECLLRPFGGVNRSGRYFGIVRKMFEKMRRAPGGRYVEAGVPILHRIWLGKPLGRERIEKIFLCDRVLQRIWVHPRTGAPVPLKSWLWTENSVMIQWGSIGQKTEVHDISGLLDGANREIGAFVRSLMYHNELAFASDLIRFLVLARFGGLHLSVHWGPIGACEKHDASSAPRFSPSTETVRVYAMKPDENIWNAGFPVRIQPDGRLVSSPTIIPMVGTIDSDLLYVGSPFLPFIQEVRTNLAAIASGRNLPPVRNVFKYYRKTLQKLRDMTVEGKRNVRTFAVLNFMMIPGANPGVITNVFPLVVAAKAHGLLVRKQTRDGNPYHVLSDACMFDVQNRMDGFKPYSVVEALGLMRFVTKSWMDFSRTYNPVMET